MALWSKTKTNSKAGFDKVYNWVDKLGAPVNRLSNKVGSEAFWPTTLDIESDKAARILKSFCSESSAVIARRRADHEQRMVTTKKKTVRPSQTCPRASKGCSRRFRPK
jgi:hypothetical protein|tara:strand:+ start:14796 stop:15119 length:324 start_codon:yes stop_codon:yes gene_type:complete